jgi:SAM-dependent methyltransferase
MNPPIPVLPQGSPAPSSWIVRHLPLIQEAGPAARALDLACGSGRHARWLAAQGLQVTAVDRDARALATLAAVPGITPVEADLEPPEGSAWPLAGRVFEAIVITNYLWRPRLDETLALLAPGGVWLHETFAQGHARFGRPSRPDFLLQPGELLDSARRHGLTVVAYEHGVLQDPPRCVQRIAAVRPTDPSAEPPPHPLPAWN